MKLKAMIALCSIGLLAGCTPPSVEEKLPEAMGNAAPVASSNSTGVIDGLIELPSELAMATDIEAVGHTLAIRSGAHLAIGSVQDFQQQRWTNLNIDAACGDMTSTADEFVLACPQGVFSIAATSPKLELAAATDTPVIAAAKTADGIIVAAAQDSTEVLYFKDGQSKQMRVTDTTDQLIAAPTDAGSSVVYRISRAKTLIQSLDVLTGEPGAILRVGLGVGQVAPGEHGMAVTADALGHQFGVYLTDPVIRLQQTTPIMDQSPWDVAWNSTTQQVWVATTTDNMLRSYDISSGVGELSREVATVADAQNIAVLDDGTVAAVSATGGGLHIVAAK